MQANGANSVKGPYPTFSKPLTNKRRRSTNRRREEICHNAILDDIPLKSQTIQNLKAHLKKSWAMKLN